MFFFFDTYAIIEIMAGNPRYDSYRNEVMLTSSLNLGELYLHTRKHYGKEEALKDTNWPSIEIIDISRELAVEAAEFKFQNKKKNLSWADCIGYVASTRIGLKFLTGDKEFKDFPNVEFVK